MLVLPIALGQVVRDRVTGFEGIAVARVEYMNHCVQFCVKPKMTEAGKMPEGEYIDDAQLEVIGDGVVLPVPVSVTDDGGPMPDTPPSQYGG